MIAVDRGPVVKYIWAKMKTSSSGNGEAILHPWRFTPHFPEALLGSDGDSGDRSRSQDPEEV
jgi:hypothetical protein